MKTSTILSRCVALGVVGALAVPRHAAAIYINPAPAGAGLDLAGPLGQLAAPVVDPLREAGMVMNLVPGNGVITCSGTLIQSTIEPRREFVLTAGHCVEHDGNVIPNANGRFRQSNSAGPFGPLYGSDRVRLHRAYVPAGQTPPPPPRFAINLHNDVALMRLNGGPGLNGVGLRRTPLNIGEGIMVFGSGNTNNTGLFETGYGTMERYAQFTVASLAPAGGYQNPPPPPSRFGARSFRATNNGNGTAANPNREICTGDSGGPTIGSHGLLGVHSYGDGNCDGTSTYMADANITLPFLHNWIDSYTQKAIFWDKLRINAAVVDSFEAREDGGGAAAYFFGENGFAQGWALTNLQDLRPAGPDQRHPVLQTVMTVAGDWRYFNAIGVDNGGLDELFLDGLSSQGEISINDRPSVIKKTFTVNVAADPNLEYVCGVQMCGSVSVDAHRRWNSLALGEDVGVGLAGGPIRWAGLVFSSDIGGIDQWTDPIPRVVDIVVPAGMQMVNVYLLNVPEPATLALLGVGAAVLMRRRR